MSRYIFGNENNPGTAQFPVARKIPPLRRPNREVVDTFPRLAQLTSTPSTHTDVRVDVRDDWYVSRKAKSQRTRYKETRPFWQFIRG